MTTSENTNNEVLERRPSKITNQKRRPPLIGTPEEILDSKERVRNYDLTLLDFDTRETVSDELFKKLRRTIYFGCKGTNSDKEVLYGKSKFLQSDVLYILSVTTPAQQLADRYNVKLSVIQNIRKGSDPSWKWEYALVRRLRKSIQTHQKYVKETRGRSRNIYAVYVHNKPEYYFTSMRNADLFRLEKFKSNKLGKLRLRGKYPIKKIDVIV